MNELVEIELYGPPYGRDEIENALRTLERVPGNEGESPNELVLRPGVVEPFVVRLKSGKLLCYAHGAPLAALKDERAADLLRGRLVMRLTVHEQGDRSELQLVAVRLIGVHSRGSNFAEKLLILATAVEDFMKRDPALSKEEALKQVRNLIPRSDEINEIFRGKHGPLRFIVKNDINKAYLGLLCNEIAKINIELGKARGPCLKEVAFDGCR